MKYTVRIPRKDWLRGELSLQTIREGRGTLYDEKQKRSCCVGHAIMQIHHDITIDELIDKNVVAYGQYTREDVIHIPYDSPLINCDLRSLYSMNDDEIYQGEVMDDGTREEYIIEEFGKHNIDVEFYGATI